MGLIGGKIVKMADVCVCPDIINLIVEKDGKYYRLTSRSLINVEEITKTEFECD